MPSCRRCAVLHVSRHPPETRLPVLTALDSVLTSTLDARWSLLRVHRIGPKMQLSSFYKCGEHPIRSTGDSSIKLQPPVEQAEPGQSSAFFDPMAANRQ